VHVNGFALMVHVAGRLPATLSYAQAAILLMLGLQHRGLEDCESELSLPSNQVGCRELLLCGVKLQAHPRDRAGEGFLCRELQGCILTGCMHSTGDITNQSLILFNMPIFLSAGAGPVLQGGT
jgi:hypothetical protein